jgi:hypothetical protein
MRAANWPTGRFISARSATVNWFFRRPGSVIANASRDHGAAGFNTVGFVSVPRFPAVPAATRGASNARSWQAGGRIIRNVRRRTGNGICLTLGLPRSLSAFGSGVPLARMTAC